MKKYILPLLLLFTISGCSQKADTPDQLAEIIVEQLINNDQDRFKNFVFTNDDALEILELGLKKYEKEGNENRITDTKEMIEGIKSGNLDSGMVRAQNETRASFAEIRAEATKDGVDWSDVKIISKDQKSKDWRGNIKADVKVTIISNGQKYKLKVDDAVKTSRGWVLTDDLRWYGKQN